jgi:hypothetical protein
LWRALAAPGEFVRIATSALLPLCPKSGILWNIMRFLRWFWRQLMSKLSARYSPEMAKDGPPFWEDGQLVTCYTGDAVVPSYFRYNASINALEASDADVLSFPTSHVPDPTDAPPLPSVDDPLPPIVLRRRRWQPPPVRVPPPPVWNEFGEFVAQNEPPHGRTYPLPSLGLDYARPRQCMDIAAGEHRRNKR